MCVSPRLVWEAVAALCFTLPCQVIGTTQSMFLFGDLGLAQEIGQSYLPQQVPLGFLPLV